MIQKQEEKDQKHVLRPASRIESFPVICGVLILSVVGVVHFNAEWLERSLQPSLTVSYRDGSSPSYCMKSDYFAAKERVAARELQGLEYDVQEPCYHGVNHKGINPEDLPSLPPF